MKAPYILLLPRTHHVFTRPMILRFGGEISIIPRDPELPIICDGCGNIIKTEYIMCLVLTEGYINSAQCEKCVETYFSSYQKYTEGYIEVIKNEY